MLIRVVNQLLFLLHQTPPLTLAPTTNSYSHFSNNNLLFSFTTPSPLHISPSLTQILSFLPLPYHESICEIDATSQMSLQHTIHHCDQGQISLYNVIKVHVFIVFKVNLRIKVRFVCEISASYFCNYLDSSSPPRIFLPYLSSLFTTPDLFVQLLQL